MENKTNSTFAKQLSYYASLNNLQQNEIAKKCQVSAAAVNSWFSGQKMPRMNKIDILCELFGVKRSDLLDDTLPSSLEKKFMTNVYNIPVFQTVSAGFGAYAEDQIVEYIPIVLSGQYEADMTIGIRVSGDSMYPKIEDGDIIVVRKQDSVDNGDIAVMLLDGEDGLVKKVKYSRNWIELISFNPEYKTKHFEGDDELSRLRVVGKVIGSYKKFD